MNVGACIMLEAPVSAVVDSSRQERMARADALNVANRDKSQPAG